MLAPNGEGATFRTGFTFLEAGRYEVVFTAKVDGLTVRSARSVVVADPSVTGSGPLPGPTPGSPEPSTPAPPASGSAKWL